VSLDGPAIPDGYSDWVRLEELERKRCKPYDISLIVLVRAETGRSEKKVIGFLGLNFCSFADDFSDLSLVIFQGIQ